MGASRTDIPKYVEQSVKGLQAQTQAHRSTWHLGEEEQWFVDQAQELIRFRFSDGSVAEAPVQIVGTFSPKDDTFLWAWDHPSVGEPLQRAANLVRDFGEQRQVPDFTTSKVTCSEDDAWAFTAVAARLAGANGAYRASAGGTLVYMTFGRVKLMPPSAEK
jgi:hypothetical protein